MKVPTGPPRPARSEGCASTQVIAAPKKRMDTLGAHPSEVMPSQELYRSGSLAFLVVARPFHLRNTIVSPVLAGAKVRLDFHVCSPVLHPSVPRSAGADAG